MFQKEMPNSVEEAKLWIIQRVIALNDGQQISRIASLVDEFEKSDFKPSDLDSEQLATYSYMIDKAEADIHAGRITPHSEVMSWIENLA
jgi:hypothetical protein